MPESPETVEKIHSTMTSDGIAATLERQIARAQQWYAEHGWITVAFDGPMPIGAIVNLAQPDDEFSIALSKIANLVISDIAKESERKNYEKFTFGVTKERKQLTTWQYIYKCEALPD